jgi:cAMP phosphodiesterase
METSFTGTLDEKRAKAKEIYSKTSLVVAKAANKHIIVEYFIKTVTKIDKLCLKINPLTLLKKLCPVTRMTNMVTCIGDQRLTRVSQSAFLTLT